eukprot:5091358-Amphidinium_carterae.2
MRKLGSTWPTPTSATSKDVRKKLGVRRARRAGSRVTRCNLPSVEEEAWKAFLARVPIDQPEEFPRFQRLPATLPDMDDWDGRGVPLGCDPD